MSASCSSEHIRIQRSIIPLLIALVVVIASFVTSGAEDLELRDLGVVGVGTVLIEQGEPRRPWTPWSVIGRRIARQRIKPVELLSRYIPLRS